MTLSPCSRTKRLTQPSTAVIVVGLAMERGELTCSPAYSPGQTPAGQSPRVARSPGPASPGGGTGSNCLTHAESSTCRAESLAVRAFRRRPYSRCQARGSRRKLYQATRRPAWGGGWFLFAMYGAGSSRRTPWHGSDAGSQALRTGHETGEEARRCVCGLNAGVFLDRSNGSRIPRDEQLPGADRPCPIGASEVPATWKTKNFIFTDRSWATPRRL